MRHRCGCYCVFICVCGKQIAEKNPVHSSNGVHKTTNPDGHPCVGILLIVSPHLGDSTHFNSTMVCVVEARPNESISKIHYILYYYIYNGGQLQTH